MSEAPSTSVMREQIQSSNVNPGMKKIQITQKNREYLVILFQVRAGKVCNITTNVSFMSTSQQQMSRSCNRFQVILRQTLEMLKSSWIGIILQLAGKN